MRRLPEELIHRIASRLVLNFAAMVFLGVTLFLTWHSSAWSSLFHWKGLAFLVCGLGVSGGIVGGLTTWLHQILTRIVVARGGGELSVASRNMIQWSGTFVLLAQFLLVYYLTTWAFTLWVLDAQT